MALFDSSAYIIETDVASPNVLANPTTVLGRKYRVSNTLNATATLTSSGPVNPFLINGVAAATLPILAGQSWELFSNGSVWVATGPAATQRQFFAGTGVSNGAGNITYTFTPPFPSVPVATLAVQTSSSNVVEARITAISVSSMTVNVRDAPTVNIRGIAVVAFPGPASGITVHAHATVAGMTP